MKAWLAIANPAAGRPGAAEGCARLLMERGLAARVAVTEGPGDATRLVREARAMDGIIALGGDGTVLEILAGLDLDRQSLAVVPLGHGNCLARDLGLPTVAAALATLHASSPRAIDLIAVHILRADASRADFLAASTLAFGYVADVVVRARESLSWLGRAAYAAACAGTRPRLRILHLDLGQGAERVLRTSLVVNNTAHLANFRALHEARLNDGRLDLMEMDAGWGRQQLHNAALLAGSRRLGPAGFRQAERVELRLEEPATLMMDGELLPGVLELTATCLPRACRCLGATP